MELIHHCGCIAIVNTNCPEYKQPLRNKSEVTYILGSKKSVKERLGIESTKNKNIR